MTKTVLNNYTEELIGILEKDFENNGADNPISIFVEYKLWDLFVEMYKIEKYKKVFLKNIPLQNKVFENQNGKTYTSYTPWQWLLFNSIKDIENINFLKNILNSPIFNEERSAVIKTLFENLDFSHDFYKMHQYYPALKLVEKTIWNDLGVNNFTQAMEFLFNFMPPKGKADADFIHFLFSNITNHFEPNIKNNFLKIDFKKLTQFHYVICNSSYDLSNELYLEKINSYIHCGEKENKNPAFLKKLQNSTWYFALQADWDIKLTPKGYNVLSNNKYKINKLNFIKNWLYIQNELGEDAFVDYQRLPKNCENNKLSFDHIFEGFNQLEKDLNIEKTNILWTLNTHCENEKHIQFLKNVQDENEIINVFLHNPYLLPLSLEFGDTFLIKKALNLINEKEPTLWIDLYKNKNINICELFHFMAYQSSSLNPKTETLAQELLMELGGKSDYLLFIPFLAKNRHSSSFKEVHFGFEYIFQTRFSKEPHKKALNDFKNAWLKNKDYLENIDIKNQNESKTVHTIYTKLLHNLLDLSKLQNIYNSNKAVIELDEMEDILMTIAKVTPKFLQKSFMNQETHAKYDKHFVFLKLPYLMEKMQLAVGELPEQKKKIL